MGVAEQALAADRDSRGPNKSFRAASRDRRKIGGFQDWCMEAIGFGNDGHGQGVLGVGLDRGGAGEEIRPGPSGRHCDVGDRRGAARQRPRLVEYHDVQRSGTFERKPVLDQQAIPRAERCRNRNDEGNSEPQGMRARDD